MKREGFIMYLKPGKEAEYEKRHNEIWDELKSLLKEAGISDYSIYWDEETNVLYASQKVEAGSSQSLGENPVVRKWWAYMADIMETNPDNSPVSKSLKEVFYLK